MNRSDGIKMASAAALLLAGFSDETSTVAQARTDDGAEGPVKVSHCQNVEDTPDGVATITTGNANFSAVMCQVLGGSEASASTARPGHHPEGAPVAVTWCNDVFTCAGLSACKGNDNAACAGQNDCHGIGFVGVYTKDESYSDILCEKLGGTVLPSI
ncbi:MAG: hypothetical protein WEB57_12550 [Pseudohongiellaceae bacterium]